MLRITVDLVPDGEETRVQQIGEMIIANDGKGNKEFSSYVFAAYDDKSGMDFGTLKNFYRANGVWNLIAQCVMEGSWEEHELTGHIIDKITMRNDKV